MWRLTPVGSGNAKSGHAEKLMSINQWTEDEITRLVAAEYAAFVNPFPSQHDLKNLAPPSRASSIYDTSHVFMTIALPSALGAFLPLAVISRLPTRHHVAPT